MKISWETLVKIKKSSNLDTTNRLMKKEEENA